MSSKIILITAVFFLLSCMPKIGEKPAAVQEQQVSGVDCLPSTFDTFETFFKGDAAGNEISASFQCMDVVLDKFLKFVRGKAKDRYTTEELAKFIERNFLNSVGLSRSRQVITPALQLEVMKVKRIFLGGELQHITFEEIQQLRGILRKIRELAVSLNPAMKVLTLNWEAERLGSFAVSSNHFENSNEKFKSFIVDFTNLILRKDATYNLTDSVSLFQELEKFFGKDWQIATKLKAYLPVAQKIKKALNGGEENSIQSSEWRGFLLLGGRGYVQYLRYHYFLRKEVSEKYGAEAKISYAARTFEDTLSIFQDMVQNKTSGVLSIDEMKEVLTAFSQVWSSFKYSEGLVREFMKMKRLVLGGGTNSWTAADFEKGQTKIAILSSTIENLLPYYAVYGLGWKPEQMNSEAAARHFAKANAALIETAQSAALLFEGDFRLTDFTAFIAEWEKLYGGSQNQKLSRKLNQYVAIFELLKGKIFKDSTGTIKKSQWMEVMKLAAQSYTKYLQYHYFVGPFAQRTEVFYPRLRSFVMDVSAFAGDLIQRMPGQMLAKSDLLKVFSELQKIGFLKDYKNSSVNLILDLILNRISVTPEQRLKGNFRRDVLDVSRIAVLLSEMNLWMEPEIFYRRILPRGSQIDVERLVQVLRNHAETASTSPESKTGIQETIRVLWTTHPLVTNEAGEVIINSQKAMVDYSGQALSTLNLNRMISRVFLRSFGRGLQNIQTYQGLTLSEVESAVNLLKPLLQDLGLITNISPTFVKSRFTEASIFMPHSNGDQMLSFEEAHDLITFMLSGVSHANRLKTPLLASCGQGSSGAGGGSIAYQCLINSHYAQMPQTMGTMPQYLNYMRSTTPQEWGSYFYQVLTAAGKAPDGKQMSTLDDIDLIPHVVQYIEMLFLKFDASRDQHLDYGDIERAFPFFRTLLLDVAAPQIKDGYLAESEMFALFLYILHYGEPPSGTWSYLTKWIPWKNDSGQWRKVKVNRTQVAGILGMISRLTSGTEVLQMNVEQAAGESSSRSMAE